ncbi:YARHG domain-containing protein [Fusobacterium sp. oral taxon 370]|uniref:YARHG domain-containing protein n=1 Tax=Fusobacterium sp. oral taxon 370 TaxID=712288 RepID=UPI0005537DFF|nr:YARHG domain-containing protein [Fusobacterium sp. oral taxon 370]
MLNNNDDLKQKLNNENIEIPKTNNTSEEEKSNINVTPKKKSNMKSGTKAQLITLGVVLFFWIFLASSVISIIKSIVRGSKKSQIVYSQVNYDTNQTAPEPETTVVEPVTTTEVETAPVENTPVTTVPEPIENTAVPQNIPETNNNVASQENTQQYSAYDDYDLQVLDKVYDEVINRGNESYLYNFSSSELAIIRNTLYARRGYRFKKKKYQQYFGSKPWYTPTTDSQNILPKKEERLANIIKKYE